MDEKGGGGSRGEGGEKRSDKGSDMTLYRTAPRLPLCRRRRYLATLTSPRHTTPPAARRRLAAAASGWPPAVPFVAPFDRGLRRYPSSVPLAGGGARARGGGRLVNKA